MPEKKLTEGQAFAADAAERRKLATGPIVTPGPDATFDGLTGDQLGGVKKGKTIKMGPDGKPYVE